MVSGPTQKSRLVVTKARVMERPSEILQALVSLERVHRADPALEPASYREQIDQAAAGGVAGWVRKRCDELMMESK